MEEIVLSKGRPTEKDGPPETALYVAREKAVRARRPELVNKVEEEGERNRAYQG